MAEQKKMVEEITSMDVDFAKWYTDVVKKAELVEYTSVKGCMVIRPYGYAIWENIQKTLDGMFKETGHENVCMPMFIPESLLNKEKDYVSKFLRGCNTGVHCKASDSEDTMRDFLLSTVFVLEHLICAGQTTEALRILKNIQSCTLCSDNKTTTNCGCNGKNN
jgi:hypothetical protein